MKTSLYQARNNHFNTSVLPSLITEGLTGVNTEVCMSVTAGLRAVFICFSTLQDDWI